LDLLDQPGVIGDLEWRVMDYGLNGFKAIVVLSSSDAGGAG